MPAAVVTARDPALVAEVHGGTSVPDPNASAKIAFGRETDTVVLTALLQLPAMSWTGRLKRTEPGLMPASGTLATAAPLAKPAWSRVALPTPGSVVPVQNSAAWNCVSLVTGAVSVSSAAPLVGFGEPVTD